MPRRDRTFTSRDMIRIFDTNLSDEEQFQVLTVLCGRKGLPTPAEEAIEEVGLLDLINGIIFAIKPSPIAIAEVLLSPFIFALGRIPEEDQLLEDLEALSERFGTTKNKKTERLIREYFERSRK